MWQQPNVLGPPTLVGYTAFLYNQLAIPPAALPTDSFNIPLSYAIATDIVSQWLAAIQTDIYTLAVYNLAADRLINFCPDQPDQNYFATARTNFSINQFVAGVVQTTYDVTTGDSFLVPEAFKYLTMLDLSTLNTPYGRTYMAFAQQLGPLWGLS